MKTTVEIVPTRFGVQREPALIGTYKGVRFRITATGGARDPYRVVIGKWSCERMRKRDLYAAIKEHVNATY